MHDAGDGDAGVGFRNGRRRGGEGAAGEHERQTEAERGRVAHGAPWDVAQNPENANNRIFQEQYGARDAVSNKKTWNSARASDCCGEWKRQRRALYQPRAKPWEIGQPRFGGLKARSKRATQDAHSSQFYCNEWGGGCWKSALREVAGFFGCPLMPQRTRHERAIRPE